MAPQAYKVFNTHAQEISGRTTISRLLHARGSHLMGMNGDVQSYIATIPLNNGEKIEHFTSEFLEFNRKLPSLEKIYLLHDFFVSAQRNCQIAINSKH